MKWQRGYRSSDVIDRRGQGGGGMRMGSLGPLVAIGSRFGIVGILAVVGIYFAGQAFLGSGSSVSATGTPAEQRPAVTSSQDGLGSFVAFVFDDAQKVWEERFASQGLRYERAELVLFEDRTASACGYGVAAVGPFYCPANQRVYIDLGFTGNSSGALARRRLCPGVRDRARGGSSRAGAARFRAARGRRARSRLDSRSTSRSSSNCKRIASPACGPTRHKSAICSSTAISAKRSVPPPPSAMTGCNGKRAAPSIPIRSRTARPINASAGSGAVLRWERSKRATRSPTCRFDGHRYASLGYPRTL